jgi:iron complex outermembrane receptor protein
MGNRRLRRRHICRNRLRYAHTKGRYDSNADGRVDSDLGGANIAPDRISGSWDRTWSEVVRSRLQVNHLVDRDFEGVNGVTTATFDGYTTVDVSADVRAFRGLITASVQNLTNEDYFTYNSQTSPLDVRYFKGLGRTFRLANATTCSGSIGFIAGRAASSACCSRCWV